MNSNKEKAKTGLFLLDFISELNIKNLGNSPRFLSITHMTHFSQWLGSYRILNPGYRADLILDRLGIQVKTQV
jgi:hypothetical protein